MGEYPPGRGVEEGGWTIILRNGECRMRNLFEVKSISQSEIRHGTGGRTDRIPNLGEIWITTLKISH